MCLDGVEQAGAERMVSKKTWRQMLRKGSFVVVFDFKSLTAQRRQGRGLSPV